MKTYLLLLTFILLRQFAFSQVNDEHAFLLGTFDKAFLKANRIEGVNVRIDLGGKTITRQYSFDSMGNLIHLITTDSRGKKRNESFWQYNRYNDKVFQKSIDYENNTADSSSYEYQYVGGKIARETLLASKYSKEYFYNKNGQIEKTFTTNNFDVLTTTLHSYDDKGNEIEHIWIQDDNKKVTKKTYDDKNRIIDYKETFYGLLDTIGKLFLHKKYSYGENGKVAKEEFLDGYFDLDKEIQEFVYDQNDNLVEYKSGKNKQSFSYNKKGFLIKKETAAFGKMKSIESYSYSIRI